MMTMASEPIHVADSSNLDQILDEASERPVRVERNGIVFRVSVDDETQNPRMEYDPDALIAAIDRVSGLFSEEEAERMIEQIYEGRRVGAPSATRS